MRFVIGESSAPSAEYVQCLGPGGCIGQVGFELLAKGCLMQTDVLRGISGDPQPPDPKGSREYIGVNIALERTTQKPAYISCLVDPRAQRDQGVFITFAKTVQVNGKWESHLDPKGRVRIPISQCFDDYCAARIAQGLTEDGKDSHKMDLLQEFLESNHLLVLYTREGKAYQTMVILSSFKKEYQRLMTTELKDPKIERQTIT